jgi:hypothetical protein
LRSVGFQGLARSLGELIEEQRAKAGTVDSHGQTASASEELDARAVNL